MPKPNKGETLSLRITAEEKARLHADARIKGVPVSTVAVGYISEGVRRSRFPAVEFRDGLPGRVAYLTGTRWPIWLIMDLLEEMHGKMAPAARHIGCPEALVRMAAAYAAAYPQEIDDCRAFTGDFATMRKIVPELEPA